MQRIIKNITPLAIREAELRAKRVAAYARVSSGKDAMLHSLSAQISHYSGLIQKTPGWEYAGVYADEAISGTKNTRSEFQRLLDDCRAGKIDMIITKSVSRFARNTLTTLRTIRELRALNVDVYFEEQNIHTLGGDGELLLTLLAVYAQEEARSVSENQKWRIKSNYEQGLPWSITMYGYKLVNGVLEIVPEEAEILRLAADLYLEGNGGINLSRALCCAGARGKRGGEMRENVIRGLLFNEKVAGDMLLQKKYVNDPIEKKLCINRGEKPQYFVTNSHEPIIDRETYERILAERERRAAKYRPVESRGPRQTYPFTGKMVCGKCGAHFRRKIANAGGKYRRAVWICTTFNTKGKAYCPSQQIPEDILSSIAARVLGLTEFDEAVFTKMVVEIRVPENGTLIFILRDGTEITETWENKSRRDSWSPEMKQQAREHALRHNHRKGGAE
ncbi:DNA invertase Pin-like site-specific DNA recombinase [Anaerotaenia torta]|uniref:recombinase family protein n=1 Tax=Anaerotaenia torta TaxID=433293 RepID=UPI003D23468B